MVISKKNGKYNQVDFAVVVNQGMKIKESEKINKYLDLTKELEKKLWNLKVTVILIVVGVRGTVYKNLEKRLSKREFRGRIETIKVIVLLK